MNNEEKLYIKLLLLLLLLSQLNSEFITIKAQPTYRLDVAEAKGHIHLVWACAS